LPACSGQEAPGVCMDGFLYGMDKDLYIDFFPFSVILILGLIFNKKGELL
jgi:hypothetical protein